MDLNMLISTIITANTTLVAIIGWFSVSQIIAKQIAGERHR